MKRSIVGAILTVGLLAAPLAHADSVAVPINDPVTDTLQLWTTVANSIASLAQDFALLFEGHQFAAAKAPNYKHAPKQLPAAMAASAALGVASLPVSTTLAANEESAATATTSPQSRSPPTADPSPVIYQVVQAPAFNASAFVTRNQFNAAMTALGSSVEQLLAVSHSTPLPQYVAADGNPMVPYAGANAGVNFSDLTAAEIPALNYFPSTSTISTAYGGTGISNSPTFGQLLLGNGSGGYNLVSTSSLGIASGGGGGSSNVSTSSQNIWSALQIFAAGASTTQLSVFNVASFGATATSSFNSVGQLTLANLTSALLSVNASGQVVSTSSIGAGLLTGSLGTINGTLLSAGGTVTITAASSTLLGNNNTFSGANTFSSLLTLTNGLISNASSTFTSTLNANTLNLTNALGVGSGGTGIFSTPSYGQLLVGNGTNYTLTATSSLGLPTFANLSASIRAAYPFALTGNATSTLTQFNGGLTAYASSTIGNGTPTGGLTIFGGATSTSLFATTAVFTSALSQIDDGCYNASQYSSIQNAITAASSTSGCVVISPLTTDTTSWYNPTGLPIIDERPTTRVVEFLGGASVTPKLANFAASNVASDTIVYFGNSTVWAATNWYTTMARQDIAGGILAGMNIHQDLQSLSADSNGDVTVVLGSPSGFTVGQFVTVEPNAGTLPQCIGSGIVTAVSGDQFTFTAEGTDTQCTNVSMTSTGGIASQQLLNFGNNGATLSSMLANTSATSTGIGGICAVKPNLLIIRGPLINDVRTGNTNLAQAEAMERQLLDTVRSCSPNTDILLKTENSLLTTNVNGDNYVTPNSAAQAYSTILKQAVDDLYECLSKRLRSRHPTEPLWDHLACDQRLYVGSTPSERGGIHS